MGDSEISRRRLDLVPPSLTKETIGILDRLRGDTDRATYLERLIRKANSAESEIRKANGIEYTPPDLAAYVASRAIELVNRSGKAKSITVIDPACGDAQLLRAVGSAVGARRTSSALRAVSYYGIDVDGGALARARRLMRSLDVKLSKTNALFPFEKSSAGGWSRLLSAFRASSGFDLVIANPPWGAAIDGYRHLLERGEFSLFTGQFDTSDLFLELALRVAKPGGIIAFIVPDSLFNAERTALRKMLVETTRIHLIARLGEKIFPEVNRACAIVICEKRLPDADHQVKCVRLTPEIRRQVLDREISYDSAEELLGHFVPQARFAANSSFSFDIDVTAGESSTFEKFRRCRSSLGSYLAGARGVELSKSGWVTRCTSCKLWFPKPTREVAPCPHCRIQQRVSSLTADQIISKLPGPGRHQIIVGESVRRYTIENTLWIDISRNGIKYKSTDSYSAPKVLVRKTGVGMAASIDYAGRLTNQVVYMFTPVLRAPSGPPLEFFLGVLNSRAIYYYLAKAHGETEWRSHPYVTQAQILSIPLPDLMRDGAWRPEVARIAKLVSVASLRASGMTSKEDARIERLVAEVFDLDRADYVQIYKTIRGVEQLLPVRALCEVSIDGIWEGV
jgi:SAM-dependent methyltransferase